MMMRVLAVLLPALTLPSCVTAEPKPLSEEKTAAAVETRIDDPTAVQRALDLVDLPPWCAAMDASSAAEGRSYWYRHTLAFNPKIRSARREVLRRVEEQAAAGGILPLGVSSSAIFRPDDAVQYESSLSIDLLGLFGTTRAESETLLASAQLRASLGAFEQVCWEQLILMRGVCDRVAVAARLVTDLEAFQTQVAEGLKRVEILLDRGWIGEGPGSSALGLASAVGLRLSVARTHLMDAQSDLLSIAGLVDRTPEQDRVPWPSTWTTVANPAASPTSMRLLQSHPRLRRWILEYAVAEAALQHVAAQTWPGLRLTPKASLLEGMLSGGPGLMVSIPDPTRADARVRASMEQREAAREVLEDHLARVLIDEDRARRQFLEAQRALESDGRVALSRSAAAWRAARARFTTEHEALRPWMDMLERRMSALGRVTERRLQRQAAYWGLVWNQGSAILTEGADS